MKKILSVLLVLTLILSAFPVGFAANLSSTCEQKAGGRKVCHTDDEDDYVRQLLVEMLEDAMTNFSSPKYYFSGVWNEAQQLYKNEVARIYATDTDTLVTETWLGYMPDETTMQIYNKLILLAALNKHEVSKAADLTKMKAELLQEVAALIKEYFKRADFSDFYWDKIVGYKDDCVADIKGAKTFADLVWARFNWEYFFVYEEYDPEEYSAWEYLEKDILNKTEMSDMATLFGEKLEEAVEDYENKGYDVENSAVDDALEAFETAAAKAHYAKQTYQAYETAQEKIAAAIGVEPEADREPVSVSVRRRALTRLREMYFAFDKENYSINNWYELESVYYEAEGIIDDAHFQDEIGDKFFKNTAKKFKEVKTYAAELKALKIELIGELKEYLGDAAYNQLKVKKLVTAGIKAINASKEIDKLYELSGKYIDALEKTINKYKIIVTKAGKGAVSKSTVVCYGDSYTVKIVPNAGYKITSITVDGKKVKLVNAYTFKNVTKAHTIKVTFSK